MSHHSTQPLRELPPHRPTLLGVWAHPDDESYLSAALMHRVISMGGNVVVATATRGELGGNDCVRECELRNAMSILGVDDVRFLGYSDGSCAEADQRDATGRILDLIAEVRPDIIVTFGPDGITGHPDHVAVSAWTTAAAAAYGHDELLYATMTDKFLRRNDELHAELGVWMEGEPQAVPSSRLAVHVVPNAWERDVKSRALRAHASQVQPLIEMIGDEAFDAWWVEEFFRRPTAAEWVAHSYEVEAWLAS